jgi:hypothetical protein
VTTYKNTEKALGEALESKGYNSIAHDATASIIASIIATDPAIVAAMRADGIIPPPPPTFKPGDRVRHFDGWIGWVVPWPRDRKYFPRQQPVAVVPEGDRSVLCVDNADLTHLTGEEGS